MFSIGTPPLPVRLERRKAAVPATAAIPAPISARWLSLERVRLSGIYTSVTHGGEAEETPPSSYGC
jgi:hypothetical protein